MPGAPNLVERDAVEEDLHVIDEVDRDARHGAARLLQLWPMCGSGRMRKRDEVAVRDLR